MRSFLKSGSTAVIKKFFGKKESAESSKELTIEDLIVLERWDEAIGQLEARIARNANDLHAHLRLAEVLVQAGRSAQALDRYLFVADMYTDDGFYDKAIALLSKVARLAPGDESLEGYMRRAKQLKMLEHRRTLAIQGLLASQEERDALSRVSLVEAQQVWSKLSSTDVVLRLSGEQLHRLFRRCELVARPKGSILAERGSREEALFLVISGVVEALVDMGDGNPLKIRTFEVGDIFGDRALLEHQAWPATYRAVEACELFRLDPDGLARTLDGNPDPRGLLDALRSRRFDHDVAATARKLLGSSA